MVDKSSSGNGDERMSAIGAEVQLREQLDDLLSRMQVMLINDAALNATAVEELVGLAQHVETVGESTQRDGLAKAAKRLTHTLKRALVVGNYTSVVTRLDFWHQLIALKRHVRELSG